MDLNQLALQWRLLLSLENQAPLHENLAAVMHISLGWLKKFCDADLSLHFFINTEMREIDVLMFGNRTDHSHLYRNEIFRIHDLPIEDISPRSKLPSYSKLFLPDATISELHNEIVQNHKIRVCGPSAGMQKIFEYLQKKTKNQLDGSFLTDSSKLILIPLGSGDFRRLGCIVLLDKEDNNNFMDNRQLLILSGFRKGLEHLLIRTFTNFYKIDPATYLPSYFKVGEKEVALLCAEIHEFYRICEILNRRSDIDRKEIGICIRKLVNCFAETSAAAIEENDGRMDQYWGSGLLGIFGEDSIDSDLDRRVPCMHALNAAAELVERFQDAAKSWMIEDFKIEKFRKKHNEYISLQASVAIDYGEVVYDYVGSSKHRVYMSLGDRVEFVKQLASIDYEADYDDQKPELLRSQLVNLLHGDNSAVGRSIITGPILLSQAAYTSSKHIIQDTDQSLRRVHQPRIINLPGRVSPYVVYGIRPANVNKRAKQY